jgi:hypothetical protein
MPQAATATADQVRSTARDQLAQHHERLVRTQDRLEAARRPLQRLQAQAEAAAKALQDAQAARDSIVEQERAALSAAMSKGEWPPAPGVYKADELHEAESNVAAAKRAVEAIQAAIAEAQAPVDEITVNLPVLRRGLEPLILAALAEEGEAALEELRAVRNAATHVEARIAGLIEFIGEEGRNRGPAGAPLLRICELAFSCAGMRCLYR